jgi:uncharacterized damage-inducible protein DinB
MIEQVISTWQIHNRINLYLLDAIAEEHLADTASSKGRTVGEQLAHMHNVRLMWLKASAPALLDGLDKLEKDNLTKAHLTAAFNASSAAIEQLLIQGFEAGKIKGMKPYPMTFLGYMISHESHHRGQIMLALKQSGHPVDKKVQFGLWEWGTR